MMKKLGRTLLLLAAMVSVSLVSGCDDVKHKVWKADQDLRTKIFFRCLESVPDGPRETKYNDWSEVVSECDTVALYQSKRCVANCD